MIKPSKRQHTATSLLVKSSLAGKLFPAKHTKSCVRSQNRGTFSSGFGGDVKQWFSPFEQSHSDKVKKQMNFREDVIFFGSWQLMVAILNSQANAKKQNKSYKCSRLGALTSEMFTPGSAFGRRFGPQSLCRPKNAYKHYRYWCK